MKKIIYSPGEPSGIGPDLIIQLCNSKFWTDIKSPIVCLADPRLLKDRAYQILYGRKYEEELENTLRSMRAEAFVEIKDLD